MQALVDIKEGSMTRRSDEDWQNAMAQEHKKLMKKTVKDLAGVVSKLTKERVDAQKHLLPTEVIDVLEAGLSTKSADQDKEEILENLQKIKKDALANAVALLNIEEEKQKESDCWDTWQKNIESIMIKADDDPDADPHPTAPLDEKDAIFSPIYSPFQKESKHWQAQRLASFATWALLGSYIGSDLANEVGGTGKVEVRGIDQFQDIFQDMIGVHKKKLVLSMNMFEPGNISTDSTVITDSLRLCFPGRLVPAPQGQPPTFLKTKLKLQNLGLYGKW